VPIGGLHTRGRCFTLWIDCRIAAKLLTPAKSPSSHVATPGPFATGTRLSPVNATRANGGTRGREWREWRPLPDRGRATLTGGRGVWLTGWLGRRAGHHLLDRGQAADDTPAATVGMTDCPGDAVQHPLDRGQAADATSVAIVGRTGCLGTLGQCIWKSWRQSARRSRTSLSHSVNLA
jgi:hypothetical protein